MYYNTPLRCRQDSTINPERLLNKLMKRLGWSPSKIVREGLRLPAACHLANGRREIIGLGQFDSGMRDLGSNKRHLKGFGQ